MHQTFKFKNQARLLRLQHRIQHSMDNRQPQNPGFHVLRDQLDMTIPVGV
jgi:hypothetical protein